MPNDSLRQIIIDSVLNSIKHQTIPIKVELINQSIPTSNNSNVLITAVGALIAAIIGGLIAIWAKRSELRNIKADIDIKGKQLDLAIRDFELKSALNWQQISNESKKIEDLKNNYELNLRKFDFNKYEKLLAIAEKGLGVADVEKIEIIKTLNRIVEDYYVQLPNPQDFDSHEMLDLMAPLIYRDFEKIKNTINTILTEKPHVLIATNEKLKAIREKIETIEYKRFTYTDDTFEGYEIFMSSEMENIFNVYELLSECVKDSLSEFGLLEKMKKNFIAEQASLAK